MSATVASQHKEIQILKEQTKDMHRASRNKNLRIVGLNELDNKSTQDTVVDFLKEQIEVDVHSADISTAERVGPVSEVSTQKPRTIFVKFTNKKIRDKIYKERLQLKKKNVKVWINEDLPKHSLKLLFQAKKLVKDGNMYTCFTKNCSVFVKILKGDKSTETQSYEDLCPGHTFP